MTEGLDHLAEEIVACRRCPRLRAWARTVARDKRAAFAAQVYWGRPVPGFGDPAARVLLIGLAPAAHGALRTGRMFTGDRSGDFLFAALHRAGFANQPVSRDRQDGLRLRDAWLTASLRCAPPANRPLPAELARCLPYLERELALLPRVRVLVALGAIAHRQTLRALGLPAAHARFAHGAEAAAGPYRLLACYHPSQQNTFTRRLTPAMLDAVLARARALAEGG
jgi:uracil-DNA glycosylase family 4